MKHAESLLPGGKRWELVWNDEFDGVELDRSKWDFRLNMMHRRHPAWNEEGAILDGEGNLRLELVKDGLNFSSPHLQTGENFMDRKPEERLKIFDWPIATLSKPKFLKKYGYFEIRCKFQTQPGWWSAFWLQSPVIGASADPGQSGVEVDIMENFNRNGEFSHNMHWNGYAGNYDHEGSGPRYHAEGSRDEFHTYGVDWSPEGYRFYVDGKESWYFDRAVSHTPQFLLISTECQSYRYNGMPAPELHTARLPDAFVVDFVRVYDGVYER